MAIEFKKSAVSGHFPEIWRGECKMLPGGFKPVQTFPVGTVLHRGTLLQVNFEEMSAAVVKVAKVLAGGTAKNPRVAKGHLFANGDRLMKAGKADASPVVSSVDTSNAEYDVLTLSAQITGLAADDVLVESTEYVAAVDANPSAQPPVEAADAIPARPLYAPNMIVGAVKEFNGKGIPAIDAAYEAVVLYPSLVFPVLDEWLNGPCLKLNPNILFIKQ